MLRTQVLIGTAKPFKIGEEKNGNSNPNWLTDTLPNTMKNEVCSTEPFCKITVLQGHHELAGNLSTGIENLLVICCYRKLAGSMFTKLFYGWKN